MDETDPDLHLEHPRLAQSPDESHNKKAIAIGVLAIVVFLGGTLWAWLILRVRTHSSIPDVARLSAPPAPTPPQIGMVFQYQFTPQVAQPALTGEVDRRLSSYGWADRTRRRIHIPLQRARELYLAGQRQGGSREGGQ